MTVTDADEFFIVFLKEEVPVDLDIVVVGLFVIFSGFLQQAETAVEFVLLDDVNKLLNCIVVVIDVADKLIINSFFILVLTKAGNVELHDIFPQFFPIRIGPLQLLQSHQALNFGLSTDNQFRFPKRYFRTCWVPQRARVGAVVFRF